MKRIFNPKYKCVELNICGLFNNEIIKNNEIHLIILLREILIYVNFKIII